MKILLEILQMITSFLGFSGGTTTIAPEKIDVAWTNGTTVAYVTLTFKDVDVLTSTIVTLLSAWLKTHENVISINIKDNTFIVAVSV